MFNQIDYVLESWVKDYERRAKLAPVESFKGIDATEEARFERLRLAKSNFWDFDQIYFPKSAYLQGYSNPAPFHFEIVKIMQKNEVSVVAGARQHAKSALGRKISLWKLLTGQINFGTTLSEDLDIARKWLAFYYVFIRQGRIANDFKVKIINFSKDALIFNTDLDKNDKIVIPFSLNRSMKGQLEGFSRPDECWGDDIETMDSPMNPDAIRQKADRIAEIFASLNAKTANMTIFANNFDERCLSNVWLKEQKNGILSNNYHVYIFPAWDHIKNRPLWYNRFPAKSEAELKNMLKPQNERDWQGNYLQNPTPPEGDIFKKEYYQEMIAPNDTKYVIYADQNLAKKSKGDTTAIVKMGYSRSHNAFYISGARCLSYSKASVFFNDYFALKCKNTHFLGMDGNVTQESTWTELLKLIPQQYYMYKNIIQFLRYNTDSIVINLQMIYENFQLFFPPGFSETPEGSTFLTYFFGFSGKKANKRDDPPDATAGALQFLLDSKITKSKPIKDWVINSINDYYNRI